MQIDTLTCPDCGTIVAGNVLEQNRVMKCPGLSCEHVHQFDHLPDEAQRNLVENRERYRID